MARQRKLKVYTAVIYPSQDVMKALGERSHIRQAHGWVVARTLKEAAALLGTNLGDWGAHLYHGNTDKAVVEACMAKPGQVFITPMDTFRSNGNMVEAAVSLTSDRYLQFGQQSDLALGEALLAKKAAERRAKIDQEAQRAKEAEERKRRREESDRMIAETLERIIPILESLGINPQTVVAGRGTQASGVEKRGILIPAEAAERIVRLADIGEQFEEDMG